jgi:hypothetical protein
VKCSEKKKQMEKTKIFENDKFSWYVTEETKLAGAYAKAKDLAHLLVAQVEDKADGRLEYVILKADEEGKTEPIFASTAINEVLSHLEALTENKE